MSRSNHDKPFYVDVGTSLVAIRCASNHDVLMRYDYSLRPNAFNIAKAMCDRMNREVEISCRMEGREMSNKNQETIEDIVAAMRDESHAGDASCLEWVGAKIRYYADRIEAANKREVEELKHWIKSAARWIKCHDIYHTSGDDLIKQAKEILNDDGEFLFKKGEK